MYIACKPMECRIIGTGASAEEALQEALRDYGDQVEEGDIELEKATPELVEWVRRNGGDERSVNWEVLDDVAVLISE